jgi:hypothetical protein
MAVRAFVSFARSINSFPEQTGQQAVNFESDLVCCTSGRATRVIAITIAPTMSATTNSADHNGIYGRPASIISGTRLYYQTFIN